MLELEERVDSLEAMFGRFIINNDNTLRRLERMIVEMRQQAEQDRERTDNRFAQMQQQAQQDRERTDSRFAQMQQQAQQDREQTDNRFAQMQQQAQQDREQTDNRFAQMQQQAQQDREQTDNRFAQMQQQAQQDREQTDKILIEMRQRAEQNYRELNQQWNKQWGDLANRLGTVAEDIVAPNLPRIAREQFGCPDEPDDFMVRRWVRHKIDNSKRREFDVIVVYPEKVLINETKSTPRINYIDDFIAVMADINGYFPEYQGKTIIPIFAGLSVPDNLLRYLTKHKIYALGMGEETMELLNFDQLA